MGDIGRIVGSFLGNLLILMITLGASPSSQVLGFDREMPIDHYDMDRCGEYWCFINLSIMKLVENVFGEENFQVQTFGNVLAATTFLQGLAVDDLPDSSLLDINDPNYQMIIGAKTVKC